MKLFQTAFLIILAPIFLNAQDKNFLSISTVANRILTSSRFASRERIVLQTNKNVYSPKENIWFEAYETDSLSGKLRNTSKILYADLIDANDKVIKSLVLNIATGLQSGAFTPDSSLSGFYWIRAYTKNILDQNINNIAVTPVFILSDEGRINFHAVADEKNVSSNNNNSLIKIFPEGGNLMSGATSVVAVKLVDEEGKPLSDSLLIKTNNNEIVARLKTNTEGLGKFSFEPSSYKKYTVLQLKNNNYDSVATLPKVNPYAAQIAVLDQNDQIIHVRILLEDSIFKKDYKTFVIGLSADSLCVTAVGSGNYEFNIPASNFPQGQASIFLYNENGELLSERNIYINKTNVTVTAQTDNLAYGARENVNLNIAVTENGKPTVSALSVSVNDSRVVDSLNNFSPDALSKLSAADADLTMLSQQNHNTFYWENSDSLINSSSANNKDNLRISGTLLTKKNQPAANTPILLLSTVNGGFILQDTTDKSGKFSFDVTDFNTGVTFSMQVKGDVNSKDNYKVIMDSAWHNNFKTPAFLKQTFSADQLQSLKKTESFYMNSVSSGQDWLPPVIVKGKARPTGTNVFPETIITKEMLHNGSVNNVADAVLRYSKLHVIGGFLMAGGPNNFKPSLSDEPQIVMDGVVAGSDNSGASVLEFLKTISTSGVDHIRILTGPSAAGYGLIKGTGVIEIYSASNSTYPNFLSANLIDISPKGFDAAPEFEMPDYADKKLKNAKIDDARTSVYWNGNIITDANGKASVSFYTADLPATYIVTVSGVTANGNKIFKTFTIARK